MITVIIPVYNVERYLKRCLDSVLAQTYSELEIILVDDGSNDSCPQLCDEYAAADKRIKVIHQKNQGLGPARNSGLDVAAGDYIAFVDSDDWIEPDMYEKMLAALEQNDCDMSACGRLVVQEGRPDKRVYCSDALTVLIGEQIIEHYLLQRDMNMAAWDKLFKASLFDGIRFPADYVSEDIVPIYKALEGCSRVAMTGEPLYNYFFRQDSLSRASFSEKKLGAYIYSKDVADDVRKNHPALSEAADFFELDAIITIYRQVRRSGGNAQIKKEFLAKLKANRGKIKANKFLTRRHKIYSLLAIMGLDRLADKIYRRLK